MKQIARCEFGGGLSEISLNKLIIKLIKKNIRIPSGSPEKQILDNQLIIKDFFVAYMDRMSFLIENTIDGMYARIRHGRAEEGFDTQLGTILESNHHQQVVGGYYPQEGDEHKRQTVK